MANKAELSVVIPAYLEEENLRVFLPRLKKVLGGMGISDEVLIIDINPPKDKTPDICLEWDVTHILREGGESYSNAIKTGIARTTGEYVMFMDADGSHPPEFIPILWQYAKENDVVIASRYVEGGDTENPKSLIWMSRALNIAYKIILGLKCKDISNSFKIYRGDALRSLKLRCSHFDIVEEILMKMAIVTKNLRIKEVPFVFKKRMFGKTKRNLLLFILSFYITLVRLFLMKILGSSGLMGKVNL